ncbi:hypothetical protein DEU34_0320 [Microbacterium sp. AG1240]|uniref:hypothetical protein n=1 Tax=Microbacterium sp. AG1240 TaxID=2183992 RepID=UPI000EB1AC51|nr:hypothetical protein [Microbacterium sp. AG1240]RKT35815.1 hypothetical protein DEU34_0320 [Microbacterium sp. AG1240]
MSSREIVVPYVRVDRPPALGEAGLRVTVGIRPDRPVGQGPQGALAHALDAAGWWIGVGDDGRATVGMGTTAGPVSLSAGDPLAAGEWAEIAVRIPGRPGDRLEVVVRPSSGAASPVRSVVVGARLVAAPGPLLWGCRGLRDRRVPQHPFLGAIGPVRVDDGSSTVAWSEVFGIDAGLLGTTPAAVL